jgi:hypothetical protein
MTNEKWIFVLESDGFDKIRLQTAPDGWNEPRVSIARSVEYFGLFRTFSTSLRFVKDGFDYVQDVYEKKGTEHEIKIGIYEYSPLPTDKYLLFFDGVIDLSTYHNDQGIYIEVDINESSFARKIKSREDINVNLSSVESIEGITLPANDEITVNLHQRELLSIGGYVLNELSATVESFHVITDGVGWDGLTVPISLTTDNNDIDNLSSSDSPYINALAGAFWNPAGQESITTFTGDVTGLISDLAVPHDVNISFRFRVYVDNTMAVIDYDSAISGASYFMPSGTVDMAFSFSIDKTLSSITEDNVICLIAVSSDGPTYKGFQIEFTQTDMTVAQNLQWKDATPSQAFLMHEVGERIAQVITDKITPFKADIFGRTDIGYSENGEASLQAVLSAEQIRQIPGKYPTISLKEWFRSMNAQRNLGLGIEFDEVNQPYLRVEKKEHFFNGNVIGAIHSVSKLTKDVAREWIYNSAKVGYDKSATEEYNGREEYNNKFDWATYIKTIKNELDLVSTIRTDGYGIEKMRRLSYETNPTEDSKEDNDNFTVIVLEDGVDASGNTKYRSAKDEGYDVVENIFSPETAYNLDLTPGRMLRRNGQVIRAGIEKYLDQSIKFQFAEQKESLQSQKTGGELIDENADIDPKTLDDPLWIAEIYRCEFIFTRELFVSITKNFGGIMKLSSGTESTTTNYLYGWILNIDYDAESKKTTGEFLRVNLNNPNLVLIDPEGNVPEITPPLPEEEIYGVFEGSFPFVFVGDSYNQITEDGSNKLLETGDNKLLENG